MSLQEQPSEVSTTHHEQDFPDDYVPNMEGAAGLFNLLNRPHGFRRTLGEAFGYFSPFSQENFWRDLREERNMRRMETNLENPKN